MRIISNNWSKVNIEFNKISFVYYKKIGYEEEIEVISSVSNDANKFEISNFFKNIAKFVCSAKSRYVNSDNDKFGHFQFMLSNKDFPEFPVKWFTLIFDNRIEIKHDIAFLTTYIFKNKQRVDFTGREKKNGKYPKYGSLKMKKRAYRFIANQALK